MEAGGDRDFGGVRVLTATYPIVVVEFPAKNVADAALHETLAFLESLLREAVTKREKVFFITDLTLMRETAPARQRQYTGEWSKRTVPLSKAAAAGSATVTPSAILRGLITAVFWVQPPPKPFVAVSTRHEAMLKGIQMLEGEGARLPPALVEYRRKGAT